MSMPSYLLSSLSGRVKAAAICVVASLSSSSVAMAASNMKADIRQVEYLGAAILRVHLQAYETDGGNRFPVTTLDRSMLSFTVAGNAFARPEVRSLTTVGAAPGAVRRALIVAFYSGRVPHPMGAAQELRAEVAGLLPKLPSAYLEVDQVDGDGARSLGTISPGHAENLVRFQQKILSLPAAGEGFAEADALCTAARRFVQWQLTEFIPADQRALILIGPGEALSSRGPAAACVASLAARGVRIMRIDWSELAGRSHLPLLQANGGFVQHVDSAMDVAPATANMAANLNDEYLVDIALPPVPLAAQPLKIRGKIDYHDQQVTTATFRLAAVHPELSPSPVTATDGDQGPPGTGFFHAFAVECLVGILLFAWLAWRFGLWLQHRSRTVSCNACGRRVAKDYGDCPFRVRGAVARFVVLSGKHAGRTLPLLIGDNIISRSPWAKLRVRGRGIAWGKHAVLRIEGAKALYLPGKKHKDRVNGWPLTEPRLLGAGHLVQIGNQRLRFEIRADARRD